MTSLHDWNRRPGLQNLPQFRDPLVTTTIRQPLRRPTDTITVVSQNSSRIAVVYPDLSENVNALVHSAHPKTPNSACEIAGKYPCATSSILTHLLIHCQSDPPSVAQILALNLLLRYVSQPSIIHPSAIVRLALLMLTCGVVTVPTCRRIHPAITTAARVERALLLVLAEPRRRAVLIARSIRPTAVSLSTTNANTSRPSHALSARKPVLPKRRLTMRRKRRIRRRRNERRRRRPRSNPREIALPLARK